MAQSDVTNNSLQIQKVTGFLNEVYANCLEYVDSVHINRGVEFLSRVAVHTVSAEQYPECLLLSSVALKNKWIDAWWFMWWWDESWWMHNCDEHYKHLWKIADYQIRFSQHIVNPENEED